VPRIETCKQSLLQKHKAPSRETNPEPFNWHGRLETCLVGCQIDAGWMTNWLFYSNHVIRGRMVE